MEIQFGDNPEITLYFFMGKHCIALPLGIDWFYFKDAVGSRGFGLSLYFLCFGFEIEIWRWKND